MKKLLLCVIFTLFLLPLAVMGQCGTENLTAQDAEGTTFNSVKVGPHCWLKPNLSIKLDSSKIYKSEMYPDTDANLATFGRLYDWYTAMNVQPGQSPVVGEHGFVQGICPEGWHLPTAAEARELMNHDAQTLHATERWLIPGTNTTGFTMLPGGYYNAMKKYGENLGGDCYMWSAQSLDPSNPTVIWSDCHCEYFLVNRGTAKNGMSVRCVYKIYQGEVTTDSVKEITDQSATLYGTIAFNGYDEEYERGFVYGTDPANLDQWVVENPAASDETAPFSKEITGLTVATTYYYQAYIINDFDTAWGEVKSFATKDLAVTTNDATDVKSTSATLNGELTKLEGYANVNAGFKYGTSASALTSIVVKDAAMDATGLFSCDIDGLNDNTKYYFKAFAANGTDTVYGEVKNFTTTGSSTFTCGTDKVKDVQENEYPTVQIGKQCWMAQNLRRKIGGEGDKGYPTGASNDTVTYGRLYTWSAMMKGAPSTNYPAGTTAADTIVHGICPAGWHVPSDAEWDTLSTFVNNNATYRCNGDQTIANALSSPTGWKNPNDCGAGSDNPTRNLTGFAAVPAGYYYNGGKAFSFYAYFWSATESNATMGDTKPNAWSRYLYSIDSKVTRHGDNKEENGYSVRCLWDKEVPAAMSVTTDSANTVTNNSAKLYGNVTNMGGKDNVYAGFKYGTSESTLTSIVVKDAAMTATDLFSCDIDGLTANTQYYFKAFAANGTDTVYGEVKNFTTTGSSTFTCGTSKVNDFDNNEYNTVKIGKQCWMKENLRTTKYADGTSISLGSTSTSTTTAYCYYPNGQDSTINTYGYLYNWPAVMGNFTSSKTNPSGVQGICPTGWHMPSDSEWTQLEHYVNSQPEYICGSARNNIAKALASTTGWKSNENDTCNVGYDQSSNNATGFSALPAGYLSGSFNNDAYFWSATQYNSTHAWYRQLGSDKSSVQKQLFTKYDGYSVRCLRDPEVLKVTTDSANTVTSNSAKLYGNVTNMGGKDNVNVGFKYGTSESALTSIVVKDVAMAATGLFSCDIDGLTANTQYYFKAFAANGTDTVYGEVKNFTTTSAVFTCGTDSVKDVDNNWYHTVQIGSQCWMAQNMRCTTSPNGLLQKGETGSSSSSPLYYDYPDATLSLRERGLLYNWYGAMDTTANISYTYRRGICPEGWHVPSDAEWDTLTYYVYNSANPNYKCSDCPSSGWEQSTKCIANALSSPMGWNNSSTSGCNAGNDNEKRNLTGFSAVAAGNCFDGSRGFGDNAYFWSATQYVVGNYAWYRGLISNYSYVYSNNANKGNGFSVRCLKD